MKRNEFAVADIEASNWVNFVVIGIYYRNEFFHFRTLKEFFKFIKKNKVSKIFFHFGGKYDFYFLIQYMNKHKIYYDCVFTGSRIHSLYILSYGIKCIDSFSIFNRSLEKLSNEMNLNFKKYKIDYDKIRYSKKLVEYLKNDCLVLYEALEKVYDFFGVFAETSSKLSLKYYNKNFYPVKSIIKLKSNQSEFVRTNYYFGGRTEVFTRQGDNLNYYDINSLYAKAMIRNKIPVGFRINTISYKTDRFGFYVVELLQDTNFRIPFLYKKVNGKLFFANFVKHSVLYITSNEIDLLIEYQIRFKIVSGFVFSEYQNIFESYVSQIYKLRLESKHSNDGQQFFYKMLLNGLYGKFSEKELKEILTNKIDVKNLTKYKEFDIENGLFYYEKLVELPYSLVHIASNITSNARTILYEYFKRADFNVLYCDTDSIITPENLDSYCNEKLGMLKKEHSDFSYIGLLPKFYIIYQGRKVIKTVCKGFTQNNFTVNSFRKGLKNDYSDFFIEYESLYCFRESMKRFNTELYVGTKTKQLNKFFDKRQLTDSIHTIPFTF